MMAARPGPSKRTEAVAAPRREATLRRIGEGDIARPSPARELQTALAVALVPSMPETRLPIAARIAVISGLAMLSWGLLGGMAYLVVG